MPPYLVAVLAAFSGNILILLVGWGFRNSMLSAIGGLELKISREHSLAIHEVVAQLKDIKLVFTETIQANHSIVLLQIQQGESRAGELERRVHAMEIGQEGWVKTLRERYHFNNNVDEMLVLHVDRLERHVKIESKLGEELTALKAAREHV